MRNGLFSQSHVSSSALMLVMLTVKITKQYWTLIDL